MAIGPGGEVGRKNMANATTGANTTGVFLRNGEVIFNRRLLAMFTSPLARE